MKIETKSWTAPMRPERWERWIAGEPDGLQWTDEASGYACVIRRNSFFGTWNGYVALPIKPEHPLFGTGMNKETEVLRLEWVRSEGSSSGAECSIADLLRCHGGVTYAGPGISLEIERYYHPDLMRHKPSPPPNALLGIHVEGIEDEDIWLIGFDCLHFGDLVPEWAHLGGPLMKLPYRNVSYVQDQCRQLAAQLKRIEEDWNRG